MSVATPAASRLLCRSLAANSAKTSTRAVAASRTHAPSPQQQQQQHHRQFHSSPPLAGRKKRSPFRNVKAEKMGLLDPERPEVMEQYKNRVSPDYDDTDVESLEKRYTPEQLEALALGESVVSSEDLVLQGRMRNDPYRMRHIEDFAKIMPIVDKRPKTGTPVDTSGRWMTPDEFGDDFIKAMEELDGNGAERPEHVDVREAYRLWQDMRAKAAGKAEGESLTGFEVADSMNRVMGPLVDNEESQREIAAPEQEEGLRDKIRAHLKKLGLDVKNVDEAEFEKVPPAMDMSMKPYKYLMERNSLTGFDGGDTALAPSLPDKVPGVAGLYKDQMDPMEAILDPEGQYQELKRQTGLSIADILVYINKNTKVLVRRYVSNQTRLGKIRSTYVLAIAGNKDGWLGMGEAKSVESEIATNKAKQAAIRNMQPIRRYENRTIYGDVEAKVGGTIVQLCARPPGFGLRISHRFFEIARAAGIHDLAAKMPRSRNPMNSVKACIQALRNQPDPEQIAIGRGRKLVDARKVYYGGAVY